MRLSYFFAAPLGPELCRGFSPHSIDPAGYLFLPAPLQVQRIDVLHRDRRFWVDLDLSSIFVFPVAERRCDHQPIFLLLPVSRPNLFANILCIVIVHQASDADHEVVFLAEGIHPLRYGDNPHLLLSQKVDKQCGLGSVTTQP